MKKHIVLLLCLVTVMAFLVGCKRGEENKSSDNKKEDTNNEVIKDLDVAKVADKLLEDVDFVAELSSKETEFVLAWFSLDADDVVEQKTYLGDGSTAELISAVKCKDADAAKKVEDAFKAYAKTNSEMYADYKPEECPKLDNPVVKVYGEYVIVCISDNNDKA